MSGGSTREDCGWGRTGAERWGAQAWSIPPAPSQPVGVGTGEGEVCVWLGGKTAAEEGVEEGGGGGLRWRGQQQAEEAAEKKSRLAAGALCLG